MSGNVGLSLRIQPRGAQHVDLGYPLAFSEYAVPPHAIHHPRAETVDVEARLGSLEWVAYRVRDNLRGPKWWHADIVGNLRVAP